MSLQQTAPTLGTAASFAVLGGSTVTNTGATIVSGNLGVSPGSAVTGFPPGSVVNGTIHRADAVASQAQTATTTAYNSLAGQACNTTLTGQDLGGKTLTSGVYCFASSAQLTGTLTLNAQGNANAVFIFQIGSTLTTASNSSVILINGGSPCNVFWQVGSSAIVGTTTTFLGNILALTSITLKTSANVTGGRALARNGAVTLDTNNVDALGCAVGIATVTPTATATTTTTPTATAVPPGAPMPTATPTATAVPPGAPMPTATPTATAVPPGAPMPTATPTVAVPPSGSGAAATQTAIAGLPAATQTAVVAATATAQQAVVAATATAQQAVVAATAAAQQAVVAATAAAQQVGQLPSQLRPHVTAPLTTPRVGQIPTQLPHTGSGGTAFLPVVALGIIFLCVGVVLRRRSRRA